MHWQTEGSEGSPDKQASRPTDTGSKQENRCRMVRDTCFLPPIPPCSPKLRGRTGWAARCDSTTMNIADTALAVGRECVSLFGLVCSRWHVCSRRISLNSVRQLEQQSLGLTAFLYSLQVREIRSVYRVTCLWGTFRTLSQLMLWWTTTPASS